MEDLDEILLPTGFMLFGEADLPLIGILLKRLCLPEISAIVYTSPKKRGTGLTACYIQAHKRRNAVFLCVDLCCAFFGRQWWGGFGLPFALDNGLSILLFVAHPV